ncbi:fasciclin domain-containing protein [Pararhizobium mangrovi]|uniref:Fasciclin domain-containing protein n=1 Tax=Pararhizobium mangrovi TaxID=2590452 RepID=A0A506TYH8_9HYPH|nr:fasciclin domain-containing protein [Pararhizobium mangrovi]TPW25774.1 fasciclin domain-containing protein [Pararhizobium mangrovi]
MFKKTLTAAALSTALAFAGGIATASAQSDPMVGGAPMSPQQTIVQNASKANNLTTLVAAVKAAGLVDTLSGKGPFTVFAPTNSAFNEVPKSTLNSLMKPANKDQLTSILTYHVVPGMHSGPDMLRDAKAHGGKLMLKTVNGEELTVEPYEQGLAIVDAKGNRAVVTTADVNQSNGVVHVINHVLMP